MGFEGSTASINHHSFEPMSMVNRKFLTLKTSFLLALASGARRSELHAVTRSGVKHSNSWREVWLQPSAQFIAKNQKAQRPGTLFSPITVPALGPTLGPNLEQDRTLCPVRALKFYLDRTKPILRDRKKLFIAFKKGYTREIAPITLSSWLKATVRLAYELIKPDELKTLRVTGHQVRAIAASWAVLGGVSVDQIMTSCHWQSHNTFTSFYLKDLAWEDGENFSLGPIVAAQQVLNL